jgi:hypothetical protein
MNFGKIPNDFGYLIKIFITEANDSTNILNDI